MNITHIRNATQLITYAGKRLLIDPQRQLRRLAILLITPTGG